MGGSYTWEEIPVAVKARFFSPWLLLTFLGTVCTLVSVVINLSSRKSYAPSVLTHKTFSGLSCLLLWTSGLRYLEVRSACTTLVRWKRQSVVGPHPGVEGSLISFTMQTRTSLFELMPGGHVVL
jgi:hypothetical protein